MISNILVPVQTKKFIIPRTKIANFTALMGSTEKLVEIGQ